MNFRAKTLCAGAVLALATTVVPATAYSSAGLDTAVTSPVLNSTFIPTKWPALQFKGTASGPQGVDSVRIAVRDQATNQWLQGDGSFAPGFAWRNANGTTSWSLAISLPQGNYGLSVRSEYQGQTDATPTWTTFSIGSRDPLLWPYSPDAFWNKPRGAASGSNLVPLGMVPPGGSASKTLRVEDDLLFFSPSLPQSNWKPIRKHTAGWSGADRCATLAQPPANVTLGSDSLFPLSSLVTGTSYGSTPNHSTGIVMPGTATDSNGTYVDYTLRETQPMHECANGTFVSQYASSAWQGDSLLTGGMGPDGSATPMSGGGAHGGSFMSAFGGTIRLGEWVPGGNIPHAVKIELDASRWLSSSATHQGRRWPALRADAYWATQYGTVNPGSQPTGAVMGALLTLPNKQTPGSGPAEFVVGSLQTEAARILARAIQNYGAYVVDDTHYNSVQFATEWSPSGRVKDQFESAFGFPLAGKVGEATSTSAQGKFLADLEVIYAGLHVVDDNTSTNVGGSGDRLTVEAPPLTKTYVNGN